MYYKIIWKKKINNLASFDSSYLKRLYQVGHCSMYFLFFSALNMAFVFLNFKINLMVKLTHFVGKLTKLLLE